MSLHFKTFLLTKDMPKTEWSIKEFEKYTMKYR